MLNRPYQNAALKESYNKYALGVTRQLIVLPTGTGKTVVFANLPNHHGLRGRIMVLVHTEELVNQAVDKIRKWNPSYNVDIEKAEQWTSTNANVIVASVATLGREGSERLKRFKPEEFDAIICDEAHHSTADSYIRIFNHFGLLADNNKKLLVGVTATPNRGDGVGLNLVYDEIVYQMSILDAIKQGWLSDLRGIRITTDTSLDSVKTRAGDFETGDLGRTVNTPARNRLIVEGWQKYAQDRQTVVFCVDVQHAKDLADEFMRAGIPSQAVWGDDPSREEKLKAHKAKTLRVLCNCNVLTEGYDDWQLACIVTARPTKSPLMFAQQIGRGTRIPEGIDNLVEARKKGVPLAKTDCIVLDVADVTMKHSLVSLPGLLGMNPKLDLKGKSAVAALEEIKAAQQQHPNADFNQLTDITKLKTFAQEIDLFRVTYSPEVVKHSSNGWVPTLDNEGYVLYMHGGETLVITKDLLNKYHIIGTVRGAQVHLIADDLESAFANADAMVRQLGGKFYANLTNRDAAWRDDVPSRAQLNLCKRLKINVPPGASKGDVTARLNRFFAQQPNRRRA